jgi:hypothetical protein
MGRRAGRFADWCWFASTLVNLVENGVERSVIVGLQREGTRRLSDLLLYTDMNTISRIATVR